MLSPTILQVVSEGGPRGQGGRESRPGSAGSAAGRRRAVEGTLVRGLGFRVQSFRALGFRVQGLGLGSGLGLLNGSCDVLCKPLISRAHLGLAIKFVFLEL